MVTFFDTEEDCIEEALKSLSQLNANKAEYRKYLIDCIKISQIFLCSDVDTYFGYSEAELVHFSIGILEQIFVINHCHDYNYLMRLKREERERNENCFESTEE